MTDATVYVYGVIRAGQELPAGRSGVGSPPAPLRPLPAGRLSAVVSSAPAGLRARRRDLMAHQETLLALAEDGPVLPMRFGMVSPDEETVVRRLSEEEEQHLEALERLDGQLEMNLKVFPAEDSLADLVREDPQIRLLHEASRRRPGYEASLRLGEAIATGLHRRAAVAAAEAVRRLTPRSTATAAGPEVTGCVLNTSFLVPRDAVAGFRADAERCAGEHGAHAEMRITGPLPCFSFVPDPSRNGQPPLRAAAGPS
ncbi:GvpL/GvpF family gas vesicle protein [Streptomyces sodiiphilus]|uniref:GvpL/GvpF family gas vesicle protein n=1 Tax=Streptomyces sodiiphilus TaxID=226217 RepID=A0ABN2P1V2_9ACTN